MLKITFGYTCTNEHDIITVPLEAEICSATVDDNFYDNLRKLAAAVKGLENNRFYHSCEIQIDYVRIEEVQDV